MTIIIFLVRLFMKINLQLRDQIDLFWTAGVTFWSSFWSAHERRHLESEWSFSWTLSHLSVSSCHDMKECWPLWRNRLFHPLLFFPSIFLLHYNDYNSKWIYKILCKFLLMVSNHIKIKRAPPLTAYKWTVADVQTVVVAVLIWWACYDNVL